MKITIQNIYLTTLQTDKSPKGITFYKISFHSKDHEKRQTLKGKRLEKKEYYRTV